jgi:Ohr subfamily peroxiredoxin
MNVLYEIKSSAQGGRAGHVKSADGILDLQLAVPKGLGGPGGERPNPEMLFSAGYAACFEGAMGFVAGQRKVKLGQAQVDCTVGIGPREGGFALKVKIEVHLPDMPRAEAQSLVDAADLVCPYSHAIRGNIEKEVVLL